MKLKQKTKWFLVAALALGGALITWANNGPVSASDQQVQATDLVGKQAQKKVDLFTGSFTYNVPINCAPARNGSEPDLALTYSSSGDDGWCGMGWNLEIGSIERNVRDGFPIQYPTAGTLVLPLNQYDDSKGFMLDLFGKSYKIFSVATNAPSVEYRAETDTDFLRCFFNTNNDSWTVYDKNGTAYYFGETTSTRVSNPKTGWSSGASGTFHWALDQIVTATGDWTTIGYTNNTNPFTGMAERTLYATQIAYNGHTNNGNGYSANFNPPDTISFQTQIRTNDWHFSFRSGFRTDQTRRLTNIVCRVSGTNVWSYRLQYGISLATARSLLTNVIIYGYSGSTATPYLTNSFAYQANPNAVSFGPLIVWTNMILSSPSGANPEITQVNQTGGGTFNYSVADLVDIDGDGLPDRVMVDSSSSPNRYLVQKNLGLQSNGSGKFGSQYYFGPISTGSASQSDSNPFPDGSGYAELNTPNGRIRDLDGDGLPDRVMDYWAPFVNSSVPYTNFTIAFNKGTNFSSPTRWPVYSGVPYSTDPLGIYQSYAAVDATSKYQPSGDPVYIGVGLWDINGDLWPDRVMSGFVPYGGMTNLYVEYNTGSSFSAQLREYPYRSQNMATYPGIANSAVSSFAAFDTSDSHFLDLNGDGLPDHLMWPANASGTGGEAGHPQSSWAVEYNNGYSFESTNNNISTVPGAADLWSGVVAQAPTTGFNYNGQPYYTDSMIESPFTGLWDVNGDGLPDRVVVDTTSYTTATPRWFVYLNNGHGFNTTPITVTNISNEGHYLSTDLEWWSPETYYYGSQITGLVDINGDGLLDRVLAVYYSSSPTANYLYVQLNNGPFPDLLTNVNNGIGGNTAVTYASSTAYDNRVDPTNPNSNSRMPFPRQVVSSVSENDGINAPQVTTYGYAAGYYDGPRREFHGFGIVTNTDPTLRSTVTYFHTGGGRNNAALGEYQDTNSATGLGNFAKSGMPYRTEEYGNDGKLYHVEVDQVDQASLGNARYFPFTTLSFDCDYPGNGTPKVTATDYAYDLTTGNLTNKVEYGQVTGFNPTNTGSFTFTDADGTDTRAYHTSYASINGNSYIVDQPAISSLTDTNNNVIQQTKYTYNDYSGTPASKLTLIASGYYATNTDSGYTMYGLVGLETDPVGVQTEITYDSTYNTFPATTRLRAQPNSDTASDFTTTTTYDARSGDILTSLDPAGITVSNTFDAFCRPIETDKISAGGGTTVWTKKYDYPAVLKSIVGGVATNYTDVVVNDGVGGFTNRTYIDGYGRTLQTRIQGENSNYRVVTTAYDGRGNAYLTTWPSFGSSIGFTKPTTTPTQMATWTGYDAYGREATNRAVSITAVSGNGAITGVSNSGGDTGSPLGAKTWTYVNGTDPWWVIFTDEDGVTRQYELDAFGRTNQIIELDGANQHTSTLKYDLADNLTNVVNANNENIFWAYNSAGDVVAMADPYLGQWTYIRDYAGRVRVQTDARGDVVSNSYVNPSTGYQDALGRNQIQTVFSFDPTNSTLVPAYTNIYVYDSGSGGYNVYKGLLYETFDSQGWEKNGYDSLARITNSTRYLNINNRSYTTSFTYNDGDKVTSTVYPDSGPIITNSYFTGGTLKQVSRSGGTETYYTVNASGYDEFGHVTNSLYGNGLTTSHAYYPISKRLETVSAGSVFTRTFTYSPGEDILSLNGTGVTNVNVTYDNLHRIKTYTGLTGSYAYDAVGNITNNVESGSSQAYGYGVRRGEAVKTVGTAAYLYDLCGNMIVRKGDTASPESLVYDAENRLVRFAGAGSNLMLVTYGYDAEGARLWKWNNQSPTNLQVFVGNYYEEKGGKTLFHIFANGQQVCTFETNSALYGNLTDTNHVAYYYHEDNLNSSCALSSGNSPASQQEVDVYYPFGRTVAGTLQAAFKVSRQFTGQIKDDETGLYYFNARYYDPELGRFTQPDNTIADIGNPQSYNRYTYCLNDPLRYTDPDGRAPSDWANAWSSAINRGATYISAGPSHWIWNGTVGTLNSLVGGLSEPLRFGSTAGALSGQGHVTVKQIAIGTLQEGGRALAIVPVGAAIGKGTGALVTSLTADGGDAVIGDAATLLKSGSCFAAGTLVQTPNGFVPIETLEEGDTVFAFDFAEKRVVERKVLRTINHITDYWVFVGINGETIKATRGHLFWVESVNAWVPALKLKPGMTVRLSNGKIAAINSVNLIKLQDSEETYNLIVATDHDYFVGQNCILVHNGEDATRITYTAPELNSQGNPTGRTYSGMATGTGTPQQVLDQRFSGSNHHPGQNLGDPEIDDVHDNRAQQRGREQMLHEESGANSANKRNPVGPDNPKKELYNKAVQEKYGYRLKC